MKIMFICTGNICRSAMAHFFLEKKVKENNLNIDVYSCGIFAENSDTPTLNAIETMKDYDINLAEHRATNIENSNIQEMDLILCMTTGHKMRVIQKYPEIKSKVYTLKEYVGEEKLDINDPWGGDIKTYKKIAVEIKNCIDKLIEKIKF